MQQKSKKWVNIGIVVFIVILIIIGIGKGVFALVAYEKRVPSDFITVEEVKKGKEYKEEDFPKDITFQYATKKDATVVGKGKLLTYGVAEDGRSSEFSAVTEKNEMYTLETGKKEGYTTKDLTLFGMTKPFSLEENSGELTITFQNKDQYEFFVHDVHEKNPWRDAYEYYKEKGKSSE